MPNAALILSPTTKITGSLAVTKEIWKMTNISSVLETSETTLHKRENITNALQLKNITKSVNTAGQPLVILQGISLEIKQGETVAVVGVSGSGKSTMLGIMAGLDLPSSGTVALLGKDISAMDEDQRAQVRAQGIGFVFQNFQLLPGLTALENVMLPLELRQESQAKKQAQELLKQVGLGARLSHYPNQLSGGEQQRVALARAFAGKPKILFADEPTGNLDSNTGKQVEDLLFALNQKKDTTLILVTHDERLALRCNRQIKIENGQLVTAKESLI